MLVFTFISLTENAGIRQPVLRLTAMTICSQNSGSCGFVALLTGQA